MNITEIQQLLQQMADNDDAVMAVQPRDWEAVHKLRREQGEQLKEIITEIGWPTISEYGEVTPKNAWLVLVHMDYDVEFQKQVLAQMKDLPRAEVLGQLIAQLADRIMIKEEQQQLYGTQMLIMPGGTVLWPVKDVENVDQRRVELGLVPLSEHLAARSETVYLTGEEYTAASGQEFKVPQMKIA